VAYDVAVIGAGWGGYTAALRASQLGLKTCLIEADKAGGTCLHRGCIPTKALLHTAELLNLIREAHRFGVLDASGALDIKAAQNRKREAVCQLYDGLQAVLRQSSVEQIAGSARFRDPHTLEVGEQTVEAASIVIASGSRVSALPGLEADGKHVLNTDQALELETLPRSWIVLGGGPSGVEFASMYRDFGCEVTLVELLPQLLPGEDEAIGRELAKSFETRGIQVLTGARLDPASLKTGRSGVQAAVGGPSGQETLKAEAMLVAVGRRPNTESLNLEAAGVESEKGYIRADGDMRTNVPHIYAVGDVNGQMPLAHAAAAQGTLAAERIAGVTDTAYDNLRVPRAVYCRPEVGAVGLTEKQARERGLQVKTARSFYRANGRATITGQPEGFVKLVVDSDTDDVLGVHALGPVASELTSTAALALTLNASAWELGLNVYAHPTFSEALGEAASRLQAAKPGGRPEGAQ
jgi:dihydrolipoamide dehydrogenase